MIKKIKDWFKKYKNDNYLFEIYKNKEYFDLKDQYEKLCFDINHSIHVPSYFYFKADELYEKLVKKRKEIGEENLVTYEDIRNNNYYRDPNSNSLKKCIKK